MLVLLLLFLLVNIAHLQYTVHELLIDLKLICLMGRLLWGFQLLIILNWILRYASCRSSLAFTDVKDYCTASFCIASSNHSRLFWPCSLSGAIS